MKILHKIIVASAMFGCAYAQNLVSVEAFDEQGNNPSQLTLRLKLTNNTSNTLNDVHAKYFLGFDRNKTLNVSPYYMAGATTSIDTVGDFLVVNINVASLAPGVFPNSSGISLGMNYTDWSAFNKQDNFSYPNSNHFVIMNNIPVYANGAIVAGLTPINDPVNEEPPKVRFVGIQPENTATRSAWVELQNYDTTSIDLSDLYLKWSASDSVEIGGGTLQPNKIIRVCKSSTLECPTSDANAVLNNLNFGLTGEFELKKQSNKIDYIAWGAQGTLDSNYSYLETQPVPSYGTEPGYSNGDFFRYVDNVGWSIYGSNEIDKELGMLPDPAPFGIVDNATVVLDSNNQVRLSWKPVKGAVSYRIKVFDNSGNAIYENTTTNSYENVSLNTGKYSWAVSAKNDQGGYHISYPLYDLHALESDDMENNWAVRNVMGIQSLPARKDTKLLVPMWGSLAETKGWNRPHSVSEEITEEESWRCWAVAVNILNKHFGGTLTQDEIVLHGLRSMQAANANHFYDFMTGNANAGSDMISDDAFQYALRYVPQIYTGAPSYTVVKNAIDARKPIHVSVVTSSKSRHVMIIDGYGIAEAALYIGTTAVVSKGDVLYHFLNVDNDGSNFWIKADAFMYSNYRIIDQPASVANTDYRVHHDTDQDGIVDYDEIVRFKDILRMDAYNYDIDHDGLKDYDDFLQGVLNCSPYNAKGELVGCYDYYSALDSDGDNLFTHEDRDSDNGGESDGSEYARNSNIFDPHGDIPSPDLPIVVRWDLPPDITIYALDALRVNDRSICFDGTGYCKVASESGREDFAINVGVQSIVGDIYSRGTVWLRSRSEVHGDIKLYSNGANNSAVNVQGGAVHSNGSTFTLDFDKWPYDVWREAEKRGIVASGNLVVPAGQEMTLRDDDIYALIKVESGGTLKVEPGEIMVNRIQLEAGSKVTFTNPGHETVIKMDGSLIWRATITNENKELVAKGFKLLQYNTADVNIEGDWAGTIHAARSSLVMGQANKLIYGRFLARTITMHQESRIYRVDFSPITQSTNLAMIYRVDFSPDAQSMNLALR
jgi:hypothetical protein